MAEHNKLGQAGEDEAVQYLIDNNYIILHRNWRTGSKELDIVAKKEGEIVFVEVKTRSNEYFAKPEDAVTPKKIKNIMLAAHSYLNKYQVDLEPRFDIITVMGQRNCFHINHLENAFDSPIF